MSLKLPQLEDVRQAATVLDGTAHHAPYSPADHSASGQVMNFISRRNTCSDPEPSNSEEPSMPYLASMSRVLPAL